MRVTEMHEEALKGCRLSPQQRRLWALLRREREAPFQAKCAVRIKGVLESGRLKTAAQNLVARHEILRTTFQSLPGMTIPMQVVEETGRISWREEDLVGSDSQPSSIDAFFHACLPTFDFERGPLLHIHLIKTAKDDHVMIVSIPAICGDSVSLLNLVGELSRGYAAEMCGKELDGDVLQYADLAEWLNELIEAEETRIGREYWQGLGLLSSAMPQLASEASPAGEAAFEPRLEELEIGQSLTAQIESLARSANGSLGQILLACWHILLWRHTGRSEVEVGAAFDGRRVAEVKGALGLFAKYLPVVCRLEERLQFREVLEQLGNLSLTMQNRQEYFSWEQLIEPSSSASALRAPFFPFCFDSESAPETFRAGDLTFTVFRQYACIDRFKIKLSYAPRAGGLAVEFHYDSRVFRLADIRCLMGHFHKLLESVAANPAAKIGELEMATDAERRRLLVEYNATKAEWPRDKFAHELFMAQMERTPEAVAVIYEDELLTYHELNERAARLAHYLRGLGVGPEAVVGLCVERSLDLIISLLAVLKAGGAYLPLDPSYPQARLSFMLEDAAVKVLLTQEHLRRRLPEARQAQVVDVDALWESLSQTPARDCGTSLSPDNLAYVIYTSGSTGRPKGVMLRHGSLNNYLLWAINYYPLGAGCGAPVHSSLSFDLTITALFPPLLIGGYVHLLSNDNEIEVLGAALSDRPGYSLVKLTPAHLQLLTEQLTDVDLNGAARSLVIGGENLSAQAVRRWREKSAATRLFNEYGPTESVVGCCVYEIGAKAEMEGGMTSIPIGQPIANTGLFILDGRQQLTPQGVIGELCVGGEGLARGYLNRPELTAERFVPHPFSEEAGDRLYRTGDLARYLRDGQIECLGRMDEQVKIRGYRIELGEIESVLRDMSGVCEAVAAVTSENGQNRLIGYIVGNEERKPDVARLRQYLKERLPEYMIPATLITLDALPLTVNGKIDRKRLPSAKDAGRLLGQEYTSARTPVEEILVGIFEDLLKVERVGMRDNFFEIGGHSLLATQVVSRVRKASGVEIGVRSLFEEPTVEGLARRIDEAMRAGEKVEAPPLVRVSGEGQRGGPRLRPPLSFAQQRLWFLDQLEPNSSLYNCPGGIRLEGRLDLEALERVINEIIRRHEALRTRFEVEEGEPVQVIDEWKARSLDVTDLANLPQEEREEEARRMAREEAGTGFDLSRGPLLRVKALKLGDEEHVLLFTMHHIVSDGWSVEILIREVGALYRAYLAGEPSPLEELPIQYADFAVWQRAWLQGDALERELEYWRRQLAGMEALELPIDYPRPAAPSYRGARRHFVVERELTRRLRELGQREGVTLFMTLLGAFDVLMSRYSGQRDVVVGTDIANRNRAEIEGLIGFFVNQLVMRVEVRPEESFRDLLKRVREVCLGAYAYQDVPFERLVEELQPERDLSRSPLFQVKLLLLNAPREELDLGGLRLTGIGDGEIQMAGEEQMAKFDLTVAVINEEDDPVGIVEYNRDLFKDGTIERLMGHYVNVLKGIVEDGGRPVSELNLLSAEEREQILVEWNATAKPYPCDQCINELFDRQAKRTPEQIALIGEEQWLSYGELNRRANLLGHYLRGLGVGPEVVVGLCLKQSMELVMAMMGVLKAGGAYLPLDPEYPLERLSFMLEDAEVGIVVTERELEERLPSFWGQTVCLNEEWRRISEGSEGEPESEVGAQNLVYVIYTSGSTGEPKGVAVHQQALVARTIGLIESYELTSDDSVLQFVSPSFDAFGDGLFTTLSCGASLVIDPLAANYSTHHLIDKVERLGITSLHIPPAYWHQLVDELFSSQRHISSQLRILATGGESPSVEKVRKWAALASDQSRYINAYGPTEATITSTVYGTQVGSSQINLQTRAPIGRPLANTQVYVLGLNREVAPIGVKGELYIGGVGVARGYLGRAEMIAGKFVPDPFGQEAGARLYRTGDVGRYLESGDIELLGRVDEQVKVRGYRIELGEIEAALDEHQSVRQSAVVVSDDEREDRRLLGYVVGDEGVTGTSLKRYLREKLPEYMIPEAILVLEEMPVTTNGKIDRKRLPSLKDAGSQLKQEYVGARTPVEEMLVGIFEEALKIHQVGQVGIHDNFFEIGGHSLLATQVVSRVRNTFGVEIGVKGVFEVATVEGLARRIEEAMRAGEKTEAPPLIKVPRDGQKSVRGPLSFAQQRLWFLDQLVPNNPFYNIPGAITLEGRLNLKALESVINEIIRRHEVLRTRIEIEKGMPAQVIDGWEPRRLQVDDLSGRTREEQEEEVSRIAREEAGTGFDLSRGPLLRVKALKLGDEEHVLLFTMHHIVSDGWSMGILIREVGALYRAYLAGDPSPLEELPIQYADFAVWQRAWLQGEPLERELEYWRRQLAGMKSLDLPTDHPRPAALSYQGAGRHFVVERELTQRLRELGQREGVTLFMTLLGGFDVLMSRYSGQQEVVVGTDIANRNRAETEGLIGFFVNQLVMRVEVRPEESFRELLRRVREVCLGAYAHQDVPFEKLVEELQPERDLSRSPLFQVKLLLQNAPREELELGGLRLMKDGDGEAQTSRFDLTVAITDAGDDLIGMVEYSSDLFKEGTIERLMGHYVNALKWIAEDVERPISDLSLLSEEEREQILVEWNETARPYPNDRCVHELFEEQVETAPEAVALIYQDKRLTYAELDARSNQLARYLRRFGVGPETLVGVCVDRSLEMVVGLLGILKAGGAYVPIDPAYPVERMAFMLDDARVKALLTQDQLLDLLPTNSVQVINLDAEWRVIAAESKERLSSGATAENLAYVIYTSGSTGRPKGVLVPHNQVANFFAAMDANIEHGPDAIWLAVTSISFDISVLELLWTLARGFQVVVHGDVRSGQPADGPQADITENDGRAIYDEDLSVPAQIVRGQVSHLQCTPSMAKMLSLGSDSSGPFSSLRQLLIGGEAFPIELAYDLKPLAPGEIRNMYGPTETTIWSTTYSLRGEERSIPIGRPIANTHTYILDRELGVAPIGVPGELYIGGKGVVRGYLNRSELTAERFLPDSFSREPGARVYRTGDLTRYSADGEIEFLGRIDHQVKIRGYRIELGEIEARLNSHPAVRQCAVIAHNYGKSEKRLAAYMVGEGEGASHASELRAYLKETLPEYMLPARFVWLDQMPLTPNGKVDRRALPAPDVNRSGMTEGYVGPRTPVEQTLARIFQEALRLDQVGIHSSFFELGGDSILGIQIISRANAAGLGLTPRQLFQHQSVAELAAVADVARPSESGEPDVVGEIPLTPVQERFFEEYDQEPGRFNQAMILESREELDIEALRKVVGRLLKQHSVLRHRFKRCENGWMQVCEEPDGTAPLEEVSLSTIIGGPAVGSIEAAAEKYLKEMNIDQGPLMRVVVFDGDKGGRRHVLIVAHHLVIDEASWRVLSEDLERWYGQARRGEEINPGAKTTSYKRWAESLKEEAQSERSREEAKYWLAQAGKRVRRLPVDKRGANTVASGRSLTTSLSVKETAALLKEVVASRKTQIDEILLSAVARAVGEWSGDQIVTVEVEGRGREETIKGLDLTRAVGCFTSRYPLRVELGGGNGAELLRNVKEQMREARRRGIYYGMLKYLSEEPDIREKLRALPEAEISFNYLGEQDSVLSEGALFRPANGRIIETRSRAGNRRHLIEVNVSIRRGRLQLVWTYSRNVHRRETIATMAESARKALRSLVSEGPSSPEQSYTPSDFPLIDIDQQRLDRILSKRAKMKDDH